LNGCFSNEGSQSTQSLLNMTKRHKRYLKAVVLKKRKVNLGDNAIDYLKRLQSCLAGRKDTIGMVI